MLGSCISRIWTEIHEGIQYTIKVGEISYLINDGGAAGSPWGVVEGGKKAESPTHSIKNVIPDKSKI